ncbi:MAG: ABC transporter permease [Rhodospirillales bacterium]|mgnify:CR=1 FL=1|jgi:ribose transport system permease protein|nr:ribose ABC transporter permease [Rhodospirillaceae bacterium]MDP6427775.1 ABC transporter permease [Rhodospirillales bacterium]MDP6644591.1 ABC transporter permease [Rhodospirillales bacterium]MDP6840275.1 ABC transporter permease [Rhodospirillales bacterium]|tara:strand:+ start:1370 stop:2371 length:1002 start_codon:yes stop_codon:yes gene_type:complete
MTNGSENQSVAAPVALEAGEKRFTLVSVLDQMPLMALVVLCLGTALLSDRFLSPVNLSNILLQASVMAIVAMGMTYVIISGGFDLSVGSIVALSGCVSAWVMLETNVPLGIAAGIAAGAAVGYVNGIIVSHLKVNTFIATLGTMVIVRGVVLLITDGRPIVGEDGLPEIFLELGSGRFLGIHYLIWVPVILFIIFNWLLHFTAYGRRLFATGGNTEAAFLAGIQVKRVVTSAYVWCGVLGGVAGVMLASRLQSGQPTAGEFYELTSIAAVVLGGAALHGGVGKLYKSMIGVFIMMVLANGLNLLNVHSYWQRVAVGLVIIAAAAADQIKSRRT